MSFGGSVASACFRSIYENLQKPFKLIIKRLRIGLSAIWILIRPFLLDATESFIHTVSRFSGLTKFHLQFFVFPHPIKMTV